MRSHDIAAALVQARKAAGISKIELARRLNVDRVTVYRWETGESIPSMDVVLNYLAATRTPVTEFLAHHLGMTSPVTAVIEPVPHALDAALRSLLPDDVRLLRRLGLLFTAIADLAVHQPEAGPALPAPPDAGTPRADDDQ